MMEAFALFSFLEITRYPMRSKKPTVILSLGGNLSREKRKGMEELRLF